MIGQGALKCAAPPYPGGDYAPEFFAGPAAMRGP